MDFWLSIVVDVASVGDDISCIACGWSTEMSRAKKPREFWVIVDSDGICYTGMESEKENSKHAKMLMRFYGAKHESIKVREVLHKPTKRGKK